jgi:sugar phosphate isomerase/epimerase
MRSVAPASEQQKAAEAALHAFLSSDPAGAFAAPEAQLDAATLRVLIERIDRAPLFAHSYAFHLNCRFGGTTPFDLLEFARRHDLAGLKIHVEDGEERSLLHMDRAGRKRLRRLARQWGLRLHVETSSTIRRDLETATAIAHDIGGESIRCYPRYEGRVREIIRRTVDDLSALREIDPEGRFHYTLEQHEDLKSTELVGIVRAVDNPRLSLLFDFGNMVNACELPEEALANMSALITEAHVKDVRIRHDRGGWAHLACRSGEGDINIPALLFRLLLLGKEAPQVTAFALEEEVGMYAPAYRFPHEEDDPLIPGREPSSTPLPEGESLSDRLKRERHDAAAQIGHVRKILGEMRALAVVLYDATKAARLGHDEEPRGLQMP